MTTFPFPFPFPSCEISTTAHLVLKIHEIGVRGWWFVGLYQVGLCFYTVISLQSSVFGQEAVKFNMPGMGEEMALKEIIIVRAGKNALA